MDQRASVGPLAAGSKLGRYEVLAKLAAGGMAVVYVARAQGVAGFERLVAVKVLHANLAHEEEFIKMFLDEARLAARIRHPNVVPTIDISDSDEAGYFIVMDYIEGDHLGQILASAHKEGETLPLPVTLRVVADALGGLGAAHDLTDESGKRLHLVHRDVSPHNIMVGRDGVARLTDFGVAKAEDRLTHTRDGQVKGKLAYMAPEQASSGQTDSRSDLFSMGVILWECITGRRLFRAESTAATLHKLLHDEVPSVSSVDPAYAPLDAVLAKALARDPADRYQTAEEFAQGIEDAAPAIGGLSSLRGVSKAVKQYAAAKLKRDKKLIDDAVHALRPSEGGAFALDGVSEPSTPSDVSSTGTGTGASHLSVSKVSGVFAHATMPGARMPTGSHAIPPQIVAPPPVIAPPPIGSVPSVMPSPRDSGMSIAPPARRGLMIAFMSAALVVLALAAWVILRGDENVRVHSMEPLPNAPVAPVADKPAPAIGDPAPASDTPAGEPAKAPALVAEPNAPATAEPAKPTQPTSAQAPQGHDSTAKKPVRAKPVVRKPSRSVTKAPEPKPHVVKPEPAPKAPVRRREPVDLMPNPYQN